MPNTMDSVEFWSLRKKNFLKTPFSSGVSFPTEMSLVIHRLESDFITKVIHPKLDDKILDIGAGCGRWSLDFCRKADAVTALEPSETFSLLCKNTTDCSNIECLQISFQEYDSDDPFNVVIISGVLMYVMDRHEAESFLAKALKLVDSKGFLILREPMASKPQWIYDWKVYSAPDEKKMNDCSYWEITRSQQFYEDICCKMKFKRVASTISHATFFYNTKVVNEKLTEKIKMVIAGFIQQKNYPFISLYNKSASKIEEKIRYYMNKRCMKILIFKNTND